MKNKQPPKVLFIVGPTASGKTALSLRIAKDYNGEIICADSQTVRREMNIGTAKPTLTEQAIAKHHLIDVINPNQQFSAAQFKQAASDAITAINDMKKLPIVVGGTGLYIDTLFFDMELIVPDTENREIYQKLTTEELKNEINKNNLTMPLNDENRRHLIATLERKGEKGRVMPARENTVIIGIAPQREVLIERINKRVEAMFEAGFLDEVRMLMQKYNMIPDGFDAIGYKIAARHIVGEMSKAEAIEKFKIADRQYAKRQITWFKRNAAIVWFEDAETAYEYIRQQL